MSRRYGNSTVSYPSPSSRSSLGSLSSYRPCNYKFPSTLTTLTSYNTGSSGYGSSGLTGSTSSSFTSASSNNQKAPSTSSLGSRYSSISPARSSASNINSNPVSVTVSSRTSVDRMLSTAPTITVNTTSNVSRRQRNSSRDNSVSISERLSRRDKESLLSPASSYRSAASQFMSPGGASYISRDSSRESVVSSKSSSYWSSPVRYSTAASSTTTIHEGLDSSATPPPPSSFSIRLSSYSASPRRSNRNSATNSGSVLQRQQHYAEPRSYSYNPGTALAATTSGSASAALQEGQKNQYSTVGGRFTSSSRPSVEMNASASTSSSLSSYRPAAYSTRSALDRIRSTIDSISNNTTTTTSTAGASSPKREKTPLSSSLLLTTAKPWSNSRRTTNGQESIDACNRSTNRPLISSSGNTASAVEASPGSASRTGQYSYSQLSSDLKYSSCSAYRPSYNSSNSGSSKKLSLSGAATNNLYSGSRDTTSITAATERFSSTGINSNNLSSLSTIAGNNSTTTAGSAPSGFLNRFGANKSYGNSTAVTEDDSKRLLPSKMSATKTGTKTSRFLRPKSERNWSKGIVESDGYDSASTSDEETKKSSKSECQKPKRRLSRRKSKSSSKSIEKVSAFSNSSSRNAAATSSSTLDFEKQRRSGGKKSSSDEAENSVDARIKARRKRLQKSKAVLEQQRREATSELSSHVEAAPAFNSSTLSTFGSSSSKFRPTTTITGYEFGDKIQEPSLVAPLSLLSKPVTKTGLSSLTGFSNKTSLLSPGSTQESSKQFRNSIGLGLVAENRSTASRLLNELRSKYEYLDKQKSSESQVPTKHILGVYYTEAKPPEKAPPSPLIKNNFNYSDYLTFISPRRPRQSQSRSVSVYRTPSPPSATNNKREKPAQSNALAKLDEVLVTQPEPETTEYEPKSAKELIERFEYKTKEYLAKAPPAPPIPVSIAVAAAPLTAVPLPIFVEIAPEPSVVPVAAASLLHKTDSLESRKSGDNSDSAARSPRLRRHSTRLTVKSNSDLTTIPVLLISPSKSASQSTENSPIAPRKELPGISPTVFVVTPKEPPEVGQNNNMPRDTFIEQPRPVVIRSMDRKMEPRIKVSLWADDGNQSERPRSSKSPATLFTSSNSTAAATPNRLENYLLLSGSHNKWAIQRTTEDACSVISQKPPEQAIQNNLDRVDREVRALLSLGEELEADLKKSAEHKRQKSLQQRLNCNGDKTISCLGQQFGLGSSSENTGSLKLSSSSSSASKQALDESRLSKAQSTFFQSDWSKGQNNAVNNMAVLPVLFSSHSNLFAIEAASATGPTIDPMKMSSQESFSSLISTGPKPWKGSSHEIGTVASTAAKLIASPLAAGHQDRSSSLLQVQSQGWQAKPQHKVFDRLLEPSSEREQEFIVTSQGTILPKQPTWQGSRESVQTFQTADETPPVKRRLGGVGGVHLDSEISDASACSSLLQSARSRQSALDVAGRKIDQMLENARDQHKMQQSAKFYQAVEELDNICDTLKAEQESAARQKTSLSTGSNKFRAPSFEKLHGLGDGVPKTVLSSFDQEKMQYTRKWLEGDLKSLASEAVKPDLLKFGTAAMDADQRSIGSASAEVAAITNKNRQVNKYVPDLLQQKKQSASIKPSPVQFAQLIDSLNSSQQMLQNSVLSLNSIKLNNNINNISSYNSNYNPPLTSCSAMLTGYNGNNHFEPAKFAKDSLPNFISNASRRSSTDSLNQSDRQSNCSYKQRGSLGWVQKRVETFENLSGDESERSFGSNGNVAYRSQLTKSPQKLALNDQIAKFIQKFEVESNNSYRPLLNTVSSASLEQSNKLPKANSGSVTSLPGAIHNFLQPPITMDGQARLAKAQSLEPSSHRFSVSPRYAAVNSDSEHSSLGGRPLHKAESITSGERTPFSHNGSTTTLTDIESSAKPTMTCFQPIRLPQPQPLPLPDLDSLVAELASTVIDDGGSDVDQRRKSFPVAVVDVRSQQQQQQNGAFDAGALSDNELSSASGNSDMGFQSAAASRLRVSSKPLLKVIPEHAETSVASASKAKRLLDSMRGTQPSSTWSLASQKSTISTVSTATLPGVKPSAAMVSVNSGERSPSLASNSPTICDKISLNSFSGGCSLPLKSSTSLKSEAGGTAVKDARKPASKTPSLTSLQSIQSNNNANVFKPKIIIQEPIKPLSQVGIKASNLFVPIQPDKVQDRHEPPEDKLPWSTKPAAKNTKKAPSIATATAQVSKALEQVENVLASLDKIQVPTSIATTAFTPATSQVPPITAATTISTACTSSKHNIVRKETSSDQSKPDHPVGHLIRKSSLERAIENGLPSSSDANREMKNGLSSSSRRAQGSIESIPPALPSRNPSELSIKSKCSTALFVDTGCSIGFTSAPEASSSIRPIKGTMPKTKKESDYDNIAELKRQTAKSDQEGLNLHSPSSIKIGSIQLGKQPVGEDCSATDARNPFRNFLRKLKPANSVNDKCRTAVDSANGQKIDDDHCAKPEQQPLSIGSTHSLDQTGINRTNNQNMRVRVHKSISSNESAYFALQTQDTGSSDDAKPRTLPLPAKTVPSNKIFDQKTVELCSEDCKDSKSSKLIGATGAAAAAARRFRFGWSPWKKA